MMMGAVELVVTGEGEVEVVSSMAARVVSVAGIIIVRISSMVFSMSAGRTTVGGPDADLTVVGGADAGRTTVGGTDAGGTTDGGTDASLVTSMLAAVTREATRDRTTRQLWALISLVGL